MLAFEVVSKDDVRRLRNRNGGVAMHNRALRSSVFNHLILGPIKYYVTIFHLCHSGPLTITQQMCCVFKFLMIEGFLYYVVHRAFHEVPGLYWMHKYHHTVNSVVLPCAANAVSVHEFVIAYMFPLAMGAWCGKCDRWSALSATSIVAITNLYIHTPALEDTLSFLPWIFVSPADHLTHHRQQRQDYAAPVFHYDRIIRFWVGYWENLQSRADRCEYNCWSQK